MTELNKRKAFTAHEVQLTLSKTSNIPQPTRYFLSFVFQLNQLCQTAVHAVTNRISSAEPSELRLLINLCRCM